MYIKRIMKAYHKQLYTHQVDNFEKVTSKANYENSKRELDNMNRT